MRETPDGARLEFLLLRLGVEVMQVAARCLGALSLPSTNASSIATFALTSLSSLFCQAFTCLRIGREIPLHSVDANRDAIDQRKRLRLFCEYRGEHARDNVSHSRCSEVQLPRSRLLVSVDQSPAGTVTLPSAGETHFGPYERSTEF